MYLTLKSPLAVGNELEDLHKLYGQCKQKVETCDQIIHSRDLLDIEKDKTLKFTTEQLVKERGSRNSIFSNPWLYFAVGLITGVVVTK